MAGWDEILGWYERLARSSPRVSLDTLGVSTDGRPLVMAVLTSPGNHLRIEELRLVNERLADPRRISGDAERARLLDRGRVVVLVTHGVHPSEMASTQVAPRIAHRLATSDAPEILRVLEETVVLQIPSLNPDGTEWVAEWSERWRGTAWEGTPRPGLDHVYAGHDTNRDWFAFNLPETEAVVTGAYHRWHPQIVLDLHQMGEYGARLFVPPYRDPVEPNVDPAQIAALNALGTRIAAELTLRGMPGVVVNAIYDAWSPARAYVHHHGGIRVLAEAASGRGAHPLELPRTLLRGEAGYDAASPSWNHPLPWDGGSWRLEDAMAYLEAAALSLLGRASLERRFWLETFHGVQRRAVAGWERWPRAWILPATRGNLSRATGLQSTIRALTLGDVEVHRAETAFRGDGMEFPAGSWVIPMTQPHASFAQALLEVQRHPDPPRVDGLVARPYDATAHTLPLLMGVEAVPVAGELRVSLSPPIAPPRVPFRPPPELTGPDAPRIALYTGHDETEATGWTRWLLDRYGIPYDAVGPERLRTQGWEMETDVLVLQSRSSRSLREGLPTGTVPPAVAGGLGTDGVRAIRDFVRGGGRLVAVEAATGLALELFDLEVTDALERLPPGAYLATGALVALEPGEDPLTEGGETPEAAWVGEASRAFLVADPTVRVAARYGERAPLLSGWMRGADRLAGRAAVVHARVGRGDVVLFGFQPNHRGQSAATWPLLLHALAPGSRGGTAGPSPGYDAPGTPPPAAPGRGGGPEHERTSSTRPRLEGTSP